MLPQTEAEIILGLIEGPQHGGAMLEASLFPAGCADSLACNGTTVVSLLAHENKTPVELKALALMVGMVRRTTRRQCSLLLSPINSSTRDIILTTTKSNIATWSHTLKRHTPRSFGKPWSALTGNNPSPTPLILLPEI